MPVEIPEVALRLDSDGVVLERLTQLGREGRHFMLDGEPHVLVTGGLALHAVRTYEDLATILLCNKQVVLVDIEGRPMPFTRTVVQDFARCLRGLFPNNPRIWPTLKGYVRGPVYRRTAKGTLACVPEGLDIASNYLILAPDWPALLPAVAPGYPHLHKLFSGLEFADPVYKANLLGVVVALFCRTGMRDFPLILLDATKKSTGKTTTMNAIACLMTGEEVEPLTYTGSEQEFEMRLGSFCGLPGPNFIAVDNIRTKRGAGYMIRSQTLSSIVHSHVTKVRKMYDGPSLLFDAVVVATMNDARVERDLADKAVVLTLSRPPGPDSHRKILPYPPDYVRAWRMELLAEIFQVIERLVLPPIDGAKVSSRFYTFEQVVVAAARELGLEASFDSARVRTVDAFVEQLLNLIHDDLPELAAAGAVPIDRLVKSIEVHPGFTELAEVLQQQPRAGKGKAKEFAEILLNTVHGKSYRWKGKVVTLILSDDNINIKEQE